MQFSTIKYQSICAIYLKIECNILYLCWLSEVHLIRYRATHLYLEDALLATIQYL
jgi:hypothetical protein